MLLCRERARAAAARLISVPRKQDTESSANVLNDSHAHAPAKCAVAKGSASGWLVPAGDTPGARRL